MRSHYAPIPEDRELTPSEARLIHWMLANARADVSRFADQVVGVRVVSRCPCGCPSINFVSAERARMAILADFVYDGPDGNPVGVFVFAQEDRLAGLEVWSIAGSPVPVSIPSPDQLRPFA